jgi:hypothetical protein
MTLRFQTGNGKSFSRQKPRARMWAQSFPCVLLKWPANSHGQVVAQDSILPHRGYPIRKRSDSPVKIENPLPLIGTLFC